MGRLRGSCHPRVMAWTWTLSLALFAADPSEVAVVEDPGTVLRAALLPTSTFHQRAACAVLAARGDRFDGLFVFTNQRLGALASTPSGYAVRSPARGIGRDTWPDRSDDYCSARLRHVVKMGSLERLPDDPDGIHTAQAGVTLSAMEVLAHELGHQWLALVDFERGGTRHCLLREYGQNSNDPTGPQCDGADQSGYGVHWSRFLATPSVMFGNVLQDLGGGRFEMSNPGRKFSELDQYLMGLRSPDEVGPMFVVDTGDRTQSGGYPIARGQTEIIQGRRVDFGIQDIVRAMGPRDPAKEACHWKMGFAIVHPSGDPPSAEEVAKVEAYRLRWEQFYPEATDGRGSMDTTLDGRGEGTPSCPASGEPAPVDAGVDAGREAARPDASQPPDLGSPEDGGEPDAAKSPDGGPPEGSSPTSSSCRCARSSGPSPWALLLLGFGGLSRLRRRIRG